MRAGCGHLREVGLDRSECLMFGSVEERGELSLVDAVVVDLLVVEPSRTDELVRPKLRQDLCAQTGIRRQRPILSKPLGEGPGADAHAEPLLDMDSNALTRIAMVVAHESIENNG